MSKLFQILSCFYDKKILGQLWKQSVFHFIRLANIAVFCFLVLINFLILNRGKLSSIFGSICQADVPISDENAITNIDDFKFSDIFFIVDTQNDTGRDLYKKYDEMTKRKKYKEFEKKFNWVSRKRKTINTVIEKQIGEQLQKSGIIDESIFEKEVLENLKSARENKAELPKACQKKIIEILKDFEQQHRDKNTLNKFQEKIIVKGVLNPKRSKYPHADYYRRLLRDLIKILGTSCELISLPPPLQPPSFFNEPEKEETQPHNESSKTSTEKTPSYDKDLQVEPQKYKIRECNRKISLPQSYKT
jgi:hypothetical protein